ncbi:MAG: glycosyltransferase family 9 protein [Anaerolineae bacterium]
MRQTTRLALLRTAGRFYAKGRGLRSPRSLLLIRPDHLGDVLFLTPALYALRRALPETHITLLVGPWAQEVIRDNTDLDAVISCPFPGFERRLKVSLLAPYRLLHAQARILRHRHYEAAVILRFDHWWGAWLAAAAGIPLRIGYDVPEVQPFLTHVLPYQPDRHEVEQNATLLSPLAGGLASLGPLRYRVRPEDRSWAADRLAAAGIRPGDRLVAIHPGAGAAVKQWPTTAWAAVADALAACSGVQLVLTGGASEAPLTQAIARLLARPVVDAAGQTTLGQLAALYERCAVVLGSDSGPLHLAVAVGTPTVHLYGPVSVARFGPWGDPERHVVVTSSWACAPCHRLDWPAETLAQHACVAAIQPRDVLAAVDRLLLHAG